VLPEPTLREVTVAYLLFRIADTFEDASLEWGEDRQLWALAELARLLREPSRPLAEKLATDCLRPAPTRHAGYLELLAEIPLVMDAFAELAAEARRSVRRSFSSPAPSLPVLPTACAGGRPFLARGSNWSISSETRPPTPVRDATMSRPVSIAGRSSSWRGQTSPPPPSTA
jgi:hypothetical protein